MKIFRHILALSTFLYGSSLIGANQDNIDSLKTLLNISQNDSNYTDLLNKLSKAYRYSDQTIAIDYAVKAEKIAKANNYSKGLALAYHNMGAIFADKSNNQLALEHYNKSLRIQQALNDKKGIAHTFGNMGLIYRRERNFDKALEHHNKSLALKRELNDSTGIAYSYGNIGLVYSEQGKYDKALIHFYNSLRMKESMNDRYGMANSFGNIGVVYLKINNIDQAQVNLERALQYFEFSKNNTGIAESLLYLGDIYAKQNNNAAALSALTRCLNIYKQKGNIKGMADSHLKIGKLQFSLEQTYNASQNFLMALDYYQKTNNNIGIVSSYLALAKFNYNVDSLDIAKYQLKNALDLAKKNKLIQKEYEILKDLAKVYLAQENYYRASEILVRTNKIGDSLNQSKLDKEVTKIQMQHEFDKQLQKTIFEENKHKLEQETKIKHLTHLGYAFFSGLTIVCILLLVILRKSKTIRNKNVILEAQQIKISEHLTKLEKQKNKLSKANDTKDRFLAIIGHDLRNPFNAINGFISMVSENPESLNKVTLNKYLRLIKDAGVNAQNLLENLLEWAFNQSGDIAVNKEKILLNHLLTGNLLLIKEIAAEKQIDIVEEFENNIQVTVDKNMINTVIRNLLSNAVKFTQPKGKIWLTTKTNNDEVKVIIRDSGIGMSKEQLATLFEPGVLKKGANGMASSGLGLILCNDFLNHHHQKLYVESTPNIGTSFWFYLPLANFNK